MQLVRILRAGRLGKYSMLDVMLRVVGGDAKSASVNLKLPTIIGRAKDATLTLPHPLVSRHHCKLFEKDGWLYVGDMGSLNGTFVDNHKLDGEVILKPEQLLTVGNVTFRATYTPAGEPISDSPNGAPVFTEELEVTGTSQAAASGQAAAELEDHEQFGDKIYVRPTDPGRPSTALTETESKSEPQPGTEPGTDPGKEPEVVDLSQAGSELEGVSKDSVSDAGLAAHSIVSALADIDEIKPPANVSLSDLGDLNVDGSGEAAKVSSIDIHDDHETNLDKVGQSFLDVIGENPADEKISPDESKLDSFINKLPR